LPRVVVLLRGLNVGTGNRVRMAELRALLERLGCAEVRTVLASGNAVVETVQADADALAETIAGALREHLGVATPVVVKTAAAWREIVDGAPMVPSDGEHGRFLVAFGRSSEDVASIAPLGSLAGAGERLVVADQAAYLACPAGVSASAMASAVLGRAGRRVTTRNWSTVLKLDALLREGGEPRSSTAGGDARGAVEVRAYRPADRRELEALWGLVFADDPPRNAPASLIDRKLREQPELLAVAHAGGALVGAAMGGYDGVRGWLYHLAVAPAVRRRGIATRLVRWLEGELAQRGCVKVNLQVRSANAEVVGFYRSLGYEVEDRVSLGRALDGGA
jgi:uncharacterized protein (DUF1697 family)/ribosomal protein S18 acetylase RimI-like enzyme